MIWHLSFRADPRALPLANRHYNRQHPGSPQFVPPGGCLVLLSVGATALWVTSTPAFVKHAWPGAWVNSLFRNERRDLHLSSDLIVEACAATRAELGEPPPLGLVTFIDADKTRRKRDPGRCYRRAGFVAAEPPETKGGLVALQLWPSAWPAAERPHPELGSQVEMWGAT